jgi:hypothetical protein
VAFHPKPYNHNYSSTLVLQDVPVPRLTSFHIDDRLVRLLHAALLNPGLDLLVRSELQHLVDFLGRPNSRATDLDTARDERKGVDGGEVTAVRGTVSSLVLSL